MYSFIESRKISNKSLSVKVNMLVNLKTSNFSNVVLYYLKIDLNFNEVLLTETVDLI